jgi:uncharacterized membrane protein
MKLQSTAAEKTLAASILFTLLLLTLRVIYTGQTDYMFYPWNIFLGIMPVYFSRQLRGHNSIKTNSIVILACWLVLFPNAPYIITDIFHFGERPGIPVWYDLLLVLSAAWNGLMAGFISLSYVDGFLYKYAGKKWRTATTCLFLFAASIGIYMGRFLRLNSWNVLTKPATIAHIGLSYTFKPYNHVGAWAFCIICTALLALIYYGIKNIAVATVKSKI